MTARVRVGSLVVWNLGEGTFSGIVVGFWKSRWDPEHTGPPQHPLVLWNDRIQPMRHRAGTLDVLSW